MPATITATLLKKWKSIASAVVTTHSTASAEVITLVHRLGRSPHRVWAQLRSVVGKGVVIASAEAMYPVGNLAVRSWNASQAILDGQPAHTHQANTGSPDIATYDIYAEFDVAAVQ